MVRLGGRRLAGRGGKLRLGCLLGLLLVGVVVYYGIPVVQVYLSYYRMLDEIRTQARQAPGFENDVIRRRLIGRAQQLGLPAEASRFVIRRSSQPREIYIATSWRDTLEFKPFYRYPIVFRPEAREPL